MELLREKDFISIWYDPRGFVKAEWKGYYSPSKIKEGNMMILECFKEKNARLGMNDARLARGTFLQSIPWLRENFFPSLIKAKVEKVAFVQSPNSASKHSLERLLELNDQYDAQVFEDYLTAEKWLLGELNADSEFTPKQDERFVIREKEKFIFLDFDDIMYAYSFEKGTAFQCREETYFTKLAMKDALTQLPEHFIQIHRSYIINTHFVASIKYHNSGSYNLFLKEMPKVKIPVSKKYVPHLKNLLKL